jgi:hypothetical protein
MQYTAEYQAEIKLGLLICVPIVIAILLYANYKVKTIMNG